MKKLNATGKYIAKHQAQPFSAIEEDHLCDLGLLRDSFSAVLLNIIDWQIGVYFALRSGGEHRRLRHYPSQITLVEVAPTCSIKRIFPRQTKETYNPAERSLKK